MEGWRQVHSHCEFEIMERLTGKVMSLSIISNIAPNTYSASLSAQTLLPLFQKIPRALWCVFMFCVYSE